MKKLFALGAVSLLAVVGLASCGGKGGKTIKLEYSGTGSDKEFNEELFKDFKDARKAAGDPNTYEITYVEHGPDKVDSEVLDWEVGPDVFEFASDKITGLYEKGALAKIVGNNATFIDENNSELGKDLASFNGSYYAYPYTGDNTYYVQYDTSFFSAEDVKSIETMLDKAQEAGKKVGYNLQEAFWGGGAMFTFGADYQMTFDEDGAVTNVTADFNTEKGLKAAKAIQKIVKHPAWQNAMEAPTPTNNLVACIAGTWDIAAYKEKLGNNYGAAVMPTVTIDGDTQHLGAFLGGKLFGINPQRAGKDTDRIVAAHELAKFLSGKEAQLKRFDTNGIAPCNVDAAKEERVTSDPNVEVLIKQAEFAHAQTAVPGNFWTAPSTLVGSLVDGTITTEEQLAGAVATFNDNVKNIQ
ncbi:MAG: extracellular solute-binding protein [Erysipelotrichales bacterium]|nr:extracellular solute-binding protein [Erysipelotrichales bacterium]